MRPKIRVSQFVYGQFTARDHWFRYVEEINRTYCEKHGYDYVLERLSEHGQIDRHGIWAKVAHIRRNLVDCDYLFYLDADACFYGHGLSIEKEILPLFPVNKILLASIDVGGESWRWCPTSGIQAGVLFFRNCETACTLLDEWNKTSEIPGHEDTRWNWPADQKALNDYIYPRYQSYIQRLKEYYQLQGRYGYFVRHLAVSSDAQRHEEFSKIYHSLFSSDDSSPQFSRDESHSKSGYHVLGDGRVSMPKLDIDIVYGCNLRCNHCNRFSPYRKGFAPTREVIQWIEAWSQKVRPNELNILGGEPLLHPDLPEILRTVQRLWGDIPLRQIWTNGLLIPQLSQDVLDALRETNTRVTISDHSDEELSYDNVVAGCPRLEANRIPHGIRPSNQEFSVFMNWDNNHQLIPFDNDPHVAWAHCWQKYCPAIVDNHLYKCVRLASVARSIQEGVLSADVWKDALTYTPLSPQADAKTVIEHLCGGAVSACRICVNETVRIKASQIPNERLQDLDT